MQTMVIQCLIWASQIAFLMHIMLSRRQMWSVTIATHPTYIALRAWNGAWQHYP